MSNAFLNLLLIDCDQSRDDEANNDMLTRSSVQI